MVLDGYWRGFKACQLQMLVEGLKLKSLEDADPVVPLWDQVKQKLGKVWASVGFKTLMCGACKVQSKCGLALDIGSTAARRKAVPFKLSRSYHVLTRQWFELTWIRSKGFSGHTDSSGATETCTSERVRRASMWSSIFIPATTASCASSCIRSSSIGSEPCRLAGTAGISI